MLLPQELPWKDQVPSLRRLLGDAQRVVEEGLHQRPQEQFLVRAMRETLDAGEVEVRLVDVGFQHAADLVRARAGGVGDGPSNSDAGII